VLVVSHSSQYSLQKNYSHIFEFVKVMSKVLSVPFPGHGLLAKVAFFNDVKITSPVRSVVQASIDGTFYNFSVTRIVRINLCQNLRKVV